MPSWQFYKSSLLSKPLLFSCINFYLVFKFNSMKKWLTLFSFIFIFTNSKAQDGYVDIGYNTVDLGADFKTFNAGSFIGLHLGYGAKLHHAFHGSIGYFIAKDNISTYYFNNTNGGLGVNIGYRYYTKPRPDGFFIGVDASLFTNKVTLTTQIPETYTSLMFIPALQTGYMLLINDQFFITPSVSVGYRTNLESTLTAEGGKAVAVPGISAGFKF